MSPTWDATDLDNGTSDGVVHEDTTHTGYDNANELRRGFNPSNPLHADALEAYYLFQERASDPEPATLHDFSGNGYNGSYNGPTLYGTPSYAGLPAAAFDGTDAVNIGTNVPLSGAHTVTVLLYKDSGVASGSATLNETVVDQYDLSPDGGYLLYFNDDNGGAPAYAVRTSGGNFSFAVANTVVNDGSWHLISGRYDGNDLSIVVDGVEEDVTTGVSWDSTHKNLRFGTWYPATGRNLQASLAFARLDNRYLTDSELQDITDRAKNAVSHTSTVKTG